jgi:hypothetical protein
MDGDQNVNGATGQIMVEAPAFASCSPGHLVIRLGAGDFIYSNPIISHTGTLRIAAITVQTA